MPPRPSIQLLSDRQFWATYDRCSHGYKNPSSKQRKMVFDELKQLDRFLIPALKRQWGKTDAYYEVTSDWNVCWHHSMGVYSDQMCCIDFLKLIQRVLAKMEHHWCFHVSLECNDDLGWGMQHAGWGQIFFYRGKIYGNGADKFNYKLFERRKARGAGLKVE